MDRPSNPFALRTTENIDSDELFLKLFSTEPMRKLQKQNNEGKLWHFVTFIQSPPGFGKTSLLRIFYPTVLKKIVSHNKETRDVFEALNKLDVKDKNRIKRCAVYLLTRSDYALIDDEEMYSRAEQTSLFLALLNVRFVIATIKTLMRLTGVGSEDLYKIAYTPQDANILDAELDFPRTRCSCKDLLDWASEKEKEIYKAINSFEREGNSVFSCSSLFVLPLMNVQWFSYPGHTLCEEFIFQLDDAHKLTKEQRSTLEKVCIETRLNVTFWIAERLDNLVSSELLETDKQERDYQVIELDKYKDKKSIEFEKMVKLIANRRSTYAMADIDLMMLLANSDEGEWEQKYRAGAQKYLHKLSTNPEIRSYENLIKAIESIMDIKERAYNARALLMFANRKSEVVETMRLFPYEPEEINSLLGETLKATEEILPAELGLPKYYGEKTLINVANVNVEQFLDFSSALFSRITAKKITSPTDYSLTAKEQDEVIRDKAAEYFARIEKMPRGDEMKVFLLRMIDFCKKQTFTDSYSYRTVSGFAVNDDFGTRRQKKNVPWHKDPENAQLIDLLRTCVAYNLLTLRLDELQGKKGQLWSVFYLNRALCVYAGIPLNYGGWRKLKVDQIKSWL